MKRTRIVLGLAIAVLFQTAILAQMVWAQITLLQSPTEAVLRTAPVDPRDIFRGDYVILSYDISTMDGRTVPLDPDAENGQEVYVVLRTTEPYATPLRTLATPPASLNEDEAVIRGKLTWANREGRASMDPICEDGDESCATYFIVYPVDSYFVPEGTGGEIEEYRNERALGVIVALNGDGDAAIKGLMLDGEKVYDEPLF